MKTSFTIFTFLILFIVKAMAQVIIMPLPPEVTISTAEQNLCTGKPQTFTARIFDATSNGLGAEFTHCINEWKWTVAKTNNGWSNPIYEGNTTGNTFTYTVPATGGPYSVKVEVTSKVQNFDCAGTNPIGRAQVYNVVPWDYNATGDISVACGQSVNLSASTEYTLPLTYRWSTTKSGPATATSINVKPLNSTLYYIEVWDKCGVVKTKTANITVNKKPVTATSSAYQCPGTTYALNASGADSYTWTPSAELVQNTPNGSSMTGSLPVPSSTYTQTYTLTARWTNGCSLTREIPVTIFSQTLPKPIITGPDRLCVTQSSQTYGAIGIDNLTSIYNWTFSATNNSATLATPATNKYATVSINPNTTPSGFFTLDLQTSNVCGIKSPWSSLWVNIATTIPPAPGTIYGPTTVCNSGSVSNYSLGQMTANTSWEVTPANAVVSTSTNMYGQCSVDWNNSFTGTAYVRVKLLSGCGDSPWSSAKTVNVVSGTCNAKSTDDQSVFMEEDLSAEIFPNPSEGAAYIRVNTLLPENTKIEITDTKGVVVYSLNNVAPGTDMAIGEDLSAGIYLIKVFNKHSYKTIRFIKQN